MFERIKSAFNRLRPLSHADIEAAYLSGATSLIDLEMRQREMDRVRYTKTEYTS